MSVERLLNVANVSSVVTAINVTDVFTDDFDVYKIVSGNLLGNNSTATGVNLRLINASGSVLASSYQYAQRVMKSESDNGNNRSTSESRIWNFFNGVDESNTYGGGYYYNYYQYYYGNEEN